MKCKRFTLQTILNIVILIVVLFAPRCKESLPVYVPPEKVLAINVTLVEQLNDHIARPGQQKVRITLVGENIHDEVFWDSVDIKGSMRIWWKRKPLRFRTLYLNEKNITNREIVHKSKMMLLPGQRFSMDVYWDVRNDDGIYLPNEMDFLYALKRYCWNNVICSNPEDFVIEVSLQVFPRLGYIIAPPKEFTFIGRMCVNSGYPPCT